MQFRHAAPLWTDADPKNAGSYFGYLDQAHYVDGVAAGLSTTTNKLGFVAAKPIGTVLRNINSFLLGAKKVNPDATVQVIFTGEWSLPVREAEATNALVNADCDVITCHVDSPKVVIETAEGRGVKTCGHNASQAPLAPKGFITGAEYKWSTIYTGYAADLAAGKPLPNFIGAGFRQGLCPEHRLWRGCLTGCDCRCRCRTGRSEGGQADLCRADHEAGRLGSRGRRQEPRQLRPDARPDRLPD